MSNTECKNQCHSFAFHFSRYTARPHFFWCREYLKGKKATFSAAVFTVLGLFPKRGLLKEFVSQSLDCQDAVLFFFFCNNAMCVRPQPPDRLQLVSSEGWWGTVNSRLSARHNRGQSRSCSVYWWQQVSSKPQHALCCPKGLPVCWNKAFCRDAKSNRWRNGQ